jgi:hypothetical protein
VADVERVASDRSLPAVAVAIFNVQPEPTESQADE